MFKLFSDDQQLNFKAASPGNPKA